MAHTMLLASQLIQARNPHTLLPFITSAQSLHCDVIFGSPSADCRGTGICKITGTVGREEVDRKKECRATRAILVENESGKGISLLFFRDALCIHLYRRHFWRGMLKIDEACEIPAEIRQQLSTAFLHILPGKYAVSESNGIFRVDLDCE